MKFPRIAWTGGRDKGGGGESRVGAERHIKFVFPDFRITLRSEWNGEKEEERERQGEETWKKERRKREKERERERSGGG